MPRESNRIPCLDGLRGISILFVVIGHWMYAYARLQEGLQIPLPVRYLGRTGVTVFFGISGFLITTLLRNDFHRFGTIHLRSFYLRRAFRILPAFWFFLILIAIVVRTVPSSELAAAFLFLTDYIFPKSDYLSHTWSLSVEEQFYLFWPVTLLLAGARRALFISAGVVVLTPVARVITFLISPHARMPFMMHTRIDSIMVGCFIALLADSDEGRRLLNRFVRPWMAAIAAVFLVLSPALDVFFRYRVVLGFSFDALAVGVIVWYAVAVASGRTLRFLSWRPLVHVGFISYSLYLWQQPFWLPQNDHTIAAAYPWGLLFAFGMAKISYFFVERPMLALRSKIVENQSLNWTAKEAPAGVTAPAGSS